MRSTIFGILMTVALGFIGAMPTQAAEAALLEEINPAAAGTLVDQEFSVIEPARQMAIMQIAGCNDFFTAECEERFGQMFTGPTLTTEVLFDPSLSATPEHFTVPAIYQTVNYDADVGCETPDGKCVDMDGDYATVVDAYL